MKFQQRRMLVLTSGHVLPHLPGHTARHLSRAFASVWGLLANRRVKLMYPFPDLTPKHFHAMSHVCYLCLLLSQVEKMPVRTSEALEEKCREVWVLDSSMQRASHPSDMHWTVRGSRNKRWLIFLTSTEIQKEKNACYGPCSMVSVTTQKKKILLNERQRHIQSPASLSMPSRGGLRGTCSYAQVLLKSKVICYQQMSSNHFPTLKPRTHNQITQNSESMSVHSV